MHDPYSTSVVIDHVAHAPAAGDLELPLLEVLSVVTVSRKVSTSAMLALMVGA
ncbi:hypothetical protein [Sphaerisporangium album]|uniref:hypothetical protein n=1 Tax=Sphaerisporangium album TaxID=509200 RepID=UPI0015EFFD9F|nr:hypothetical protein [Sphaerisporangium album]